MNTRPCPCCGCESEPLGKLGSLVHYRCRNCGMMYSHRKPSKKTR